MADLYPMLTVEEATARLLSHFSKLPAEKAPILEALDRRLAEDIVADGDIPPHANTAMDGYAVRAADTQGATAQAPRVLKIVADLAAGYVATETVVAGTAIRIMTGAPMPDGADAVVRFEDTECQGDHVHIQVEVPTGENVRSAGEDVRRGDVVLRKGIKLRPQEIGMLASLGRSEVSVIRRPRVAILATGDELVSVDATLGPGKIRDANSYSNAAQVLRLGAVPLMLGIARDQMEDLTSKIRAGLAQGVDLFLTSGGVSVGDFDVVKKVLAAEGEIAFWRVKMKPGKPLAFGRIAGVPVVGLPGNPVSAMVSFELLVRPAILTMLGASNVHRLTTDAVLMDGIGDKDNRRHYLRVRVRRHGDEVQAYLTGEQGSGILRSMVEANGLAIIPAEWRKAEAGARVQVILLDADEGCRLPTAALQSHG